MNLGQQLENAPKNLVLYFLGLIGAIVDDYALVTLTIFCVLLGFVLGSVLIPATVFFGAYFVLRMVIAISMVIDQHARATAHSNAQIAQAISVHAEATAVNAVPRGVVVEGDILP